MRLLTQIVFLIPLLQFSRVQSDCVVQNTIANVIQAVKRVEDRVDCHPDPHATQEKCVQRGCIWDPEEEPLTGAPWCVYPPGYGYNMVGQPVNTQDGYLIHLRKSSSN